jgi:hypothetical protein
VKKTSAAWFANIWIAGDSAKAVQACREFCMVTPLCVTVTSTSYVYTGGMQDGVCVRLIAYPRFETPVAELRGNAERLAEHLCNALCQESYSIEYPTEIEWTSYRA